MVQNKIALVTGGGRGLGKDTALSIAKKGIDVVLTYNSNKNAADEVVKEIQALGQKAATLKLDVADIVNFDSFISELQVLLQSEFTAEKINFLVNNGGFGASNSSIAETTEEQFNQLMNVYFKGVFFLHKKYYHS